MPPARSLSERMDRLYERVLDAYLAEDWERYEELKAKYQELVDELDPIYIGPVWSKNEDGSWKLPEKTLGWQIISWCYEYMSGPDGSGQMRFTPEQARFILW